MGIYISHNESDKTPPKKKIEISPLYKTNGKMNDNTDTQQEQRSNKMMNSKIKIMLSKKLAHAECSPREEKLLAKSTKSRRRSQRVPKRRSDEWESVTEEHNIAAVDPISLLSRQ